MEFFSTFKTDLSDNLVLLAGLDFRIIREFTLEKSRIFLSGQYLPIDDDVSCLNQAAKLEQNVLLQ
jgi:hypothetical protein